jgi:hypothetical protein
MHDRSTLVVPAALVACSVWAPAGLAQKCPPSANNCFQQSPDSTPGCNNVTCCEAVCALDPFCCEAVWDAVCASSAQATCADPACAPSAGPCNVPNPTPGCDDIPCCNTVCLADPFCCDQQWDADCAQAALAAGCVGPPPANDACAAAVSISNGTTAFTNVDATDDGPAPCGMLGADVWYTYVAGFSGTLTVTTCGSDFDTVLAVYAGCDCPVAAPLACNDDASSGPCAFTLQSLASVTVVAGQCYTIQVAGFGGTDGSGVLNLSKQPVVCPISGNDCFQPAPSPGCSDADCCGAVCAQQPSCCSASWDASCAALAQSSCGSECPEDIDGDGVVEVEDLVAVILDWGCMAPPACAGDVTGDGETNVEDLVAVILGWGPCG